MEWSQEIGAGEGKDGRKRQLIGNDQVGKLRASNAEFCRQRNSI